ncbi:MAG: AzlC family ABC transporter permease [Lachnospiraceae bacterium]|nr:AzlC family ABC transporter permease [Lachnospiraceae bacterium]MDD7377901.1 AzlC family ABC transporter permease [Lachnospiraceae bacterium]MDY4617951.1 AzlC family ABC transporter permease [Lachnospiraceae bacterium]
MPLDNKTWFQKGVKDGIPIALGYFAVSFTLGITAKNAGLTALQAMLASFTLNASAGEFAGFTLIAAGASYLEVAIMEFVANARYLLMSCALSQKIPSDTPLLHRLIIGYDVTDEIFGISIAVPGKLNPFYTFGAIAIAVPGWSIGTYLGVVMGNILPANIVSALSVGLYGMFIAIIIPPARKSKIIAGIVAVSMAASFAFAKLPLVSNISSGVRTILLTVMISALAAYFFPVKEESSDET